MTIMNYQALKALKKEQYCNTTYRKKIISILKNAQFSGKGSQSFYNIYAMRIRKMLISYVRLDHTLTMVTSIKKN